MKRLLFAILLALGLSSAARSAVIEPTMYEAPTKLTSLAAAVTGHTVTLNWVLSVDDDAGAATPLNCVAAAGCLQNVWRAPGACSTTSSFSVITTTALSPTVTTFSGPITPGVFCYAVTFTMNGLSSSILSPSPDVVTVSLPPSPVTGLTESSQ